MTEKKSKQAQKEVTEDKDDKNPFHKRQQVAIGTAPEKPRKKPKFKWYRDEKPKFKWYRDEKK